jgi:beta-mannosidase
VLVRGGEYVSRRPSLTSSSSSRYPPPFPLPTSWPTGGWGTIEYGTVGFTGGQVIGGRWKPAHYNFITGYADVFGACGKAGACYLKNDGALTAVSANVALNVLHIATGSVSALLAAAPVALPRGANAMHWYCASGAGSVPPACPSWSSALPAAGCAPDGSDCVLQVLATDATTGAVLSSNWQLLALPSSLALPRAKLTWTVAPSPNADRSVNVTVSAAPASPAQDVGSALFVTLTTLAQGRFSDNNFHLPAAATRTLAFLPFLPGQESVLAESLRVEHLAQYVLGA